MFDRIPQWGPHEAQIALNVTLLTATALLALLCDVLRYRTWNEQFSGAAAKVGPISEAALTLRNALAPTLVPADGIQLRKAPRPAGTSRASRLAAALKQPRRALSPAARAAIERGAHAAQAQPAGISLPAGFQDASMLSRLTAEHCHVTGLVVSISLAGSPGAAPAETVQKMIASLLDASDFAAPVGAGEYILILPGQQGPIAQHRMREISQHLWDLQMQSLLQHGVSFQWGGLEAVDQDIEEAVRMAQDRRASRGERKLPMAQAAKAAQRAV